MNPLMQLSDFLNALHSHLGETAIYVSFFWFVHALNHMLGRKLHIFGIIPRQPFSLIMGPIASPYLHADLNHLFYNSLPLSIMVAALFTQGVSNGIAVITSIAYLEGILVWVFARHGNHIGASGLILGLFGYFLYLGYYNPSIETIAIALVLLYYFGTILFSIFPADLLTSFEGHFFG